MDGPTYRLLNFFFVCYYTEEDEELRKAVELSLQDVGKFELSVNNNLNRDNSAADAANVDGDTDDDDADDDDDNDDNNDNNDDEATVSQYLNLNDDDDDNDFMSSNAFGIIKDVRVNNIVASDTDKISEFDSKNFKQMLSQHRADSAAYAALLMNGSSHAWTNFVFVLWSELELGHEVTK